MIVSDMIEGLVFCLVLTTIKPERGNLVVNDDAELLTVREVAKRLRVDDTTVRRWIKNGALEAITLPHNGKRQVYRVRGITLDALIASPLPKESVSQ
jgi:excisionase family DNA binding protein